MSTSVTGLGYTFTSIVLTEEEFIPDNPDRVFILTAKVATSAPAVALLIATFAPVEATPLMLVPASVVVRSVTF
ncbi:unknown [Tannerella sp. CAG:118]|nr:unknown [Tannerella sp. CAG:118]